MRSKKTQGKKNHLAENGIILNVGRWPTYGWSHRESKYLTTNTGLTFWFHQIARLLLKQIPAVFLCGAIFEVCPGQRAHLSMFRESEMNICLDKNLGGRNLQSFGQKWRLTSKLFWGLDSFWGDYTLSGKKRKKNWKVHLIVLWLSPLVFQTSFFYFFLQWSV